MTVGYQILAGSFSLTEKAQIERAMEAVGSRPGTVIRATLLSLAVAPVETRRAVIDHMVDAVSANKAALKEYDVGK